MIAEEVVEKCENGEVVLRRAGFPGVVPDVRRRRAGCPGLWPDVRLLQL